MSDQDAPDASPNDPTITSQPDQQGPTATVQDWRELLAQRRLTAARQAYLVARRLRAVQEGRLESPTDRDDEVERVLTALADVEDLVRQRAYVRAKARLERFEARVDWVPWQRLEDDLDVLAATSKALDSREPDAALEGLAALQESWFESDVLTQRGTAMIYRGEFEEAGDTFAKALELDPQHFRALTNLGNVALEQGKVDEAIGHYEAAIKLNDSFANAHHNLGVAYRRKGQVGKSVKSLRRAQRVSQRNETAEARESFSRWTGNQNSRKYLKWFLYAVMGGVVWWLLRSQGVI